MTKPLLESASYSAIRRGSQPSSIAVAGNATSPRALSARPSRVAISFRTVFCTQLIDRRLEIIRERAEQVALLGARVTLQAERLRADRAEHPRRRLPSPHQVLAATDRVETEA